MDFEFTEEQRQLREAVEGFLAKEYTFERLRAIQRSGGGWDRAVWGSLAELGVTALNVPVSCGGLGFGPSETLALLEPVLTSAVIATALLRQYETTASVAPLLRAMAGGERIVALAHAEPRSRFDTRWVETRAEPFADGYTLTGQKSVVAHAGIADTLIVSARIRGAAGEERGMALFLVPRDAAGLRLAEFPTLDGQRAAEVYLTEVRVGSSARVSGEGEALPAIEAALDVGLAALCAEAVGIMEAVVKSTVDYLNTRQQFGQPIGRFQVLQHRVADMVIHLEQARSMSYLAAMRCTSCNAAERRRELSAAKVVIGDAARFVGQQSIQLHGGMGMTDEMRVSHWFKRLTAIEMLFGDGDFHLQRYAESMRSP